MTERRQGRPGRRFPRAAVILGLLLAAAAPALAFQEAEVSAIVGNVKTSADYPGSGGVWMARQRIVEVDGVGNAVITEHLLARVFDPAWGRQQFSPYRRTYWNEFTSLLVRRARVWHSRQEFEDLPSEAFREEVSPQTEAVGAYARLREVSIEFPRVAPGDVVELRFAWTFRVPPYERNARWSVETFGAEDPVIEQQLVWVTPTAATVDTGVTGRPLRGTVRLVEGQRVTQWITGNLPPVRARFRETPWSRRSRPATRSACRRRPRWSPCSAPWTESSTTWGPHWETAWNQRSAEVDRMASEVTARRTDPAVRARDLEAVVRKGIRTLDVRDADLGMRPLPATEVLLEKAGGSRDKSCLLVALLRSAGVEASPVLVRTRVDSLLSRVPSFAQFDRFLVRARLPGGEALARPYRLAPGDSTRAWPALRRRARSLELQHEAGLVEFPGLPRPGR